MTVSSYILIQTEVGKASAVVDAVRGPPGVVQADDVTGPYDVILRAEADSIDELGRMVVSQIQLVDGHHPHPDLPRRAPLRRDQRVVARVSAGGRPAGAACVACDREVDEPVEQRGVRQPGHLPQLRVHRDRREPGDRVQLVHDEARRSS